MNKKKTRILSALGGVLALLIIGLIFKLYSRSQIISSIPEMNDLQALSIPVREQVSEAIDRAQQFPSADNLGALGMVYHSNAIYKQAALCYELAIRRNKKAWIWNYYRAYLSLEMGESSAVIEYFDRVVERNPEVYHAWYYLGRGYRNLGNSEAAEKSLTRITRIHEEHTAQNKGSRKDQFPLRIYASFQLSRLYFESGRNDLAEKTLKEILEVNRSFGPAYRILGNIYSMSGDTVLRKYNVERANDLVGFAPPIDTLIDRLALLSRSESYLLKRIDDAQRHLHPQFALRLTNNAIRYNPDNKYVIAKALKIYLWIDMEDECSSLIDSHMHHFLDEYSELYNVGTAFFQKAMYTQSILYFSRALELRPEEIKIQEELAVSYWFSGKQQKAHELLNSMIEKNPDNQEVLAIVANILYYNFKETERARKYLPGLLARLPSNPKVQKLAAGIAEEDGDFERAVVLYESSIRGNPKDLTTIKFLGTSFSDREMWDRAIQHYREALSYYPNNPYFLERLGTLLVGCPDITLRNTEEAKEYLERAFIHMSSSLDTQVYAGRGLAFAYINMGEKDNSIRTITEVMNIARRANFSSSYQAELLEFYKAVQTTEN